MPTSTGVPVIDNAIRLVLAILELIAFVMMASRMLKMLHRHEYAQLIATLFLFGIALWIIMDPSGVANLIKSLFSGANSKISGGGGGVGTGQ